jgi:hypothetical protein
VIVPSQASSFHVYCANSPFCVLLPSELHRPIAVVDVVVVVIEQCYTLSYAYMSCSGES